MILFVLCDFMTTIMKKISKFMNVSEFKKSFLIHFCISCLIPTIRFVLLQYFVVCHVICENLLTRYF